MLRYFLLFGLMMAVNIAVGQPNPQKAYPKRIAAITELLQTDSLNYKLIWERLEMQVNLLDSHSVLENAFSANTDSVKNLPDTLLQQLGDLQRDFGKIYANIILHKKFDVIEEGDFYLNRMLFYIKRQEWDWAITDAVYLRHHASYSRYSERGSYYNDWALYALFKLYVLKRNYVQALEAIDAMLEKKRKANPAVYYCAAGSFVSYADKIRLYELFNKRDALIAFLVESCAANFTWYFNNSAQQDYFSDCAKAVGFDKLNQLVQYMQAYHHKDFRKYRRIYLRLASRVPGSEGKINSTLSDRKLHSALSAILK